MGLAYTVVDEWQPVVSKDTSGDDGLFPSEPSEWEWSGMSGVNWLKCHNNCQIFVIMPNYCHIIVVILWFCHCFLSYICRYLAFLSNICHINISLPSYLCHIYVAIQVIYTITIHFHRIHFPRTVRTASSHIPLIIIGNPQFFCHNIVVILLLCFPLLLQFFMYGPDCSDCHWYGKKGY